MKPLSLNTLCRDRDGTPIKGRAGRHKDAHHGRDDPADADWVPTTSIGHPSPIQDVQTGIQHPMIKLEGTRAEVTTAPQSDAQAIG